MLQNIIGGTPVCYHLILQGSIDLEKMEKSLNAVIHAHPALQLSFEIPPNSSSFAQWRVKFLENPKVSIRFQDISNLSEDVLLLEYNRLLNKKNPLANWPLFEFVLFKTGLDEFHLFMGIDHVIADGLGNIQILHQWLAHYSNLEEPIKYSVQNYVDVVTKINNYQPSGEELLAFQSLISKVKKESYFWNPHQRNLDSLVPDFKTVCRKVSKETTLNCLKTAETLRVSLYAIIVAAYLDLFFGYYEKGEKMIFTLPTSGQVYPEVDASSYIGCFAQALTLVFARDLLQLPLKERLQRIHEEIHSAIQMGFDHIQVKKMAHSIRNDFKLTNGELSPFSKTLFRSSMKSNIYISYTGHSSLKKTYRNLRITGYKEGTFNNAGVCDFMHTIFDEQLYLFGNYDAKFFELRLVEEVMDRLSNWFNTIQPETLSTSIKTPQKEVNDRLVDYLLRTFALVHTKKIHREQFDHDLEGKLGLDSLGRIRLITRISKDYSHKINRNELFKCRTLHELAHALEDQALPS
jgi:fengycin family lipopeptide synthetase B